MMFGVRRSAVNLKHLGAPVRQFIEERCGRRLGVAAQQTVAQLEQRGSTFLVRVRAANTLSRCTVRPCLTGQHICEAGELQRVHGLVRGSSPALAQGLPMVLDIDPERQWVVFEYLTGEPLLEVLRGCLRRGSLREVIRPLRQTAHLLAEINKLPAGKLNLGQPIPLHADYVRKMDLCTADRQVRRWLPKGDDWQRAMASVTGSDFERRHGERVLLVDCQPKNVVVSPAGEARCIDIDYSTGSPAMNVAQFLVALDRLGLRHPQRQRQRLIGRCKSIFVRAYLEVGESWIGGDLAFFYPWLLMRSLREHAQLHRFLGGYVRRSYGKTLRHLLLGLERGLPVTESVAVPMAA